MNIWKKLRLHAEIATMREAAKRLNIHESTIGKWERGQSNPELSRLPAVVKLYNCTAKDLQEIAKAYKGVIGSLQETVKISNCTVEDLL